MRDRCVHMRGERALHRQLLRPQKLHCFMNVQMYSYFNRPIKGLRSLNNEYFVILLIVTCRLFRTLLTVVIPRPEK